jgi:ABC-type uncharacterized transport system fused permease/ATPase subunit
MSYILSQITALVTDTFFIRIRYLKSSYQLQVKWKICIPAALDRVIQEEKATSCEPVELKFVVHLLTLIHFSDVVLKAAVRTTISTSLEAVTCQHYFDVTALLFYFTLLLLHQIAQRLWKDGW